MDLEHVLHQSALTEANFHSPVKLREVVAAAKALERALKTDLDPTLMKLKAVQEQRRRCEKWKDKFSKNVNRYLMNMINHVGNDTDNLESGLGNQSVELKLSRRQRQAFFVRFLQLFFYFGEDFIMKFYGGEVLALAEFSIR